MARVDDTRAKRFEYVRLCAAIRRGRVVLNPREMTEALIEAGAPAAAGNYYWRIESGRIQKLSREWADAIVKVAGVDAMWLSMLPGSSRLAPEGYAGWLAAESSRELPVDADVPEEPPEVAEDIPSPQVRKKGKVR